MTSHEFPSLRQLRAFAAVAASQSISGAAKVVNLSQPGVTESVRALEDRVGTQLFERRGTGCYLTTNGAVLLPRVHRFFDQLRIALSDGGAATINGAQALNVTLARITGPQIRGLIAISENSSFDAAARALKISEPSLHRAAKSLERELRRRLYQRTSRGMTTTSLGSEIARRFQIALRELAYGMEELQAARGNVVTRVVVGNIPHSGTQILSSAINEFFRTYPTATVRIVDGHYEELLDDLRTGKLDFLFGVLRLPDWAKDVAEEELFTDRYVVVGRAGHPLTRVKTLSLRELARYHWIMPGPVTPRQQAFRRMFASLPELPKISVETTSLQIYRDLLATSDQLTLMSALEAQLNEPSKLAVLSFRSAELHRCDGIATRADWQPTRIHRHFLEALRMHAGQVGAHSPEAKPIRRRAARSRPSRRAEAG
ncbi:MAG TPA: LysR family transcriptional regulator [Xanthobacteraceae bacterium]|jgi:DNA-binding transcriptional LysR family regulator|nr:LysR family transcriptional regulator [Xanthobacteraceae bacterium]